LIPHHRTLAQRAPKICAGSDEIFDFANNKWLVHERVLRKNLDLIFITADIYYECYGTLATLTSKFKRNDENALAQGPELLNAEKDQKNIDMLPDDTKNVAFR